MALCDTDEAPLAAALARVPGARGTCVPEEVLDAPDVDVVAVASYDDCHHAQVLRALRNGKHVFVEKPLCQYRQEAEEIRAALRAKPQVRLTSNLILRRSPRFRHLKALADEGALGTPYYLEGDYNYGRLPKLTDGWRGRLPFYSVVGGGGVHVIDLMLWVIGLPVVEVEAWGNRIASGGTRFHFDDLVVVLLRFASGAIGKVAVNMGCVHPHFHPFVVYGTRGSFVNGRDTAWLYTSRDPAVAPTSLSDPYPGVHKGALAHDFVDTILHGTPPVVSPDDVFRAMAVVLAADESLASGRRVTVQPL